MNKRCLICNSAYKNKYDVLLKCTKCGFITTDLEISNDEIKKIYTADYFHGNEYADYINDKAIIQKNFYFRLKTLLKYLDNSDLKKLFEIGCAYGFFLELASVKFKKVDGIDISNDAVEYIKKNQSLNISSGDFLEYQFTEKFDVFCMWDTIEHLKEPHLFIKKISENINSGGLIAFTTGDVGSLNAKIRGRYWRQIHPPVHLHYFNKKSLKILLQNYGFKVKYIGHPGSYFSLYNIFYIILVLKREKMGLFNLIEKTGILNKMIYLNLYDLVYVIAEKE